jgi:pyruvate kinase
VSYEIIPTLGPATQGDGTLSALRAAGATALRLNTSHLSLDELQRWLERLPRVLGSPLPVPLVLDLQGSKWRLGDFAPFALDEGQRVELVQSASATSPGRLPVPHGDFFRAAACSSGEIVLNDAKCVLTVERVEGARLSARVARGGEVSPHKGITLTGSTYRRESLSEKDREIVSRTRALADTRYALSYVRDAAEMASYRRALGESAHLAAKLERDTALHEAGAVARFADELWLCRGDLGAEMGMRAMARAVHRFTRGVARLPVPVLLAGQVLEHMTESSSPTRSEICYLHDALAAGFRGVVLSDETAIGRYPIEACRTAAMFRGQRDGERLSASHPRRAPGDEATPGRLE